MKNEKRLWLILAAVVGGAFLLLGFFGREVYRQAPPLPERVLSSSGALLMSKEQILDGQQVWQSIGGQQVGSIWGHGAYQAPDWSADWLHRESLALLERWSRAEHGRAYAELGAEPRAALERRLRTELRANRYDAATGILTVSEDRAQAIASTADHYKRLFGGDESLAELREHYALSAQPISDPARSEEHTSELQSHVK